MKAMSTPLDIAVDIAGELMRSRGAGKPLNVARVARDISARHSGAGYSHVEIADALAEEGIRAGLLPRRPRLATLE